MSSSEPTPQDHLVAADDVIGATQQQNKAVKKKSKAGSTAGENGVPPPSTTCGSSSAIPPPPPLVRESSSELEPSSQSTSPNRLMRTTTMSKVESPLLTAAEESCVVGKTSSSSPTARAPSTSYDGAPASGSGMATVSDTRQLSNNNSFGKDTAAPKSPLSTGNIFSANMSLTSMPQIGGGMQQHTTGVTNDSLRSTVTSSGASANRRVTHRLPTAIVTEDLEEDIRRREAEIEEEEAEAEATKLRERRLSLGSDDFSDGQASSSLLRKSSHVASVFVTEAIGQALLSAGSVALATFVLVSNGGASASKCTQPPSKLKCAALSMATGCVAALPPLVGLGYRLAVLHHWEWLLCNSLQYKSKVPGVHDVHHGRHSSSGSSSSSPMLPPIRSRRASLFATSANPLSADAARPGDNDESKQDAIKKRAKISSPFDNASPSDYSDTTNSSGVDDEEVEEGDSPAASVDFSLETSTPVSPPRGEHAKPSDSLFAAPPGPPLPPSGLHIDANDSRDGGDEDDEKSLSSNVDEPQQKPSFAATMLRMLVECSEAFLPMPSDLPQGMQELLHEHEDMRRELKRAKAFLPSAWSSPRSAVGGVSASPKGFGASLRSGLSGAPMAVPASSASTQGHATAQEVREMLTSTTKFPAVAGASISASPKINNLHAAVKGAGDVVAVNPAPRASASAAPSACPSVMGSPAPHALMVTTSQGSAAGNIFASSSNNNIVVNEASVVSNSSFPRYGSPAPRVAGSPQQSYITVPSKHASPSSPQNLRSSSPTSAHPSHHHHGKHHSRGVFRPTIWDTVERNVEQQGTVLVLDFQTLSGEGAVPNSRTLELVSSAVGRVLKVFHEYDGVVHTFSLESVVVTFNVQKPCAEHGKLAVFCALSVAQQIDSILDFDIPWGIGLAQGQLAAGDTGTTHQRSFVVCGAAMELAKDLSSLNYIIGSRILMPENIHDEVQQHVVALLVDFVADTHSSSSHCSLFPVFELRGDIETIAAQEQERAEARAAAVAALSQTSDSFASNAQHVLAALEAQEDFYNGVLPDDAQVAYLESFFLFRRGMFREAKEHLESSIDPSFVKKDMQLQRFVRLATYYSEHPKEATVPYFRKCQIRWENLEAQYFETMKDNATDDGLDQFARQPSPSLGARRASRITHTHESPTRIIEAITRAHSATREASMILHSPPNEMSQTPAGRMGSEAMPPLNNTVTSLDGQVLALSPLHLSQQNEHNVGSNSVSMVDSPVTQEPRGASQAVSPQYHPFNTFTPVNVAGSIDFRDVNGVLWRRSEKQLGKGAFGEVFLGMRVDDGKLVAMKQLHIPDVEGDPNRPMNPRMMRAKKKLQDQLEQLVSEVRMLCQLRHPNIVFFLGCGIIETDILISMEYVSGGSLQTCSEQFGSLPVSAVQRYMKDVLRGLNFLHEQQIIHRDVKPHNVLLTVDGACKVTDFGTSVQLRQIVDSTIVVGTPQYMSPEQASGPKTTCFQSDLWSIGIMTIQLLTGDIPVKIPEGPFGQNKLMMDLASGAYEVTIPDGLPPTARSFVEQCLQREPEMRGTADELLLHPFLMTSANCGTGNSTANNNGVNAGGGGGGMGAPSSSGYLGGSVNSIGGAHTASSTGSGPNTLNATTTAPGFSSTTGSFSAGPSANSSMPPSQHGSGHGPFTPNKRNVSIVSRHSPNPTGVSPTTAQPTPPPPPYQTEGKHKVHLDTLEAPHYDSLATSTVEHQGDSALSPQPSQVVE